MIFFRFLGRILDYIQNHFKAFIFLLLLVVLFAPFGSDNLQKPNLSVIKIEGEIGNIDKIMDEISQATHNPAIKGVLLKVDSPGGALAPSVELSLAIKRLASHKPVIAYASGNMTSGSYYASIWANKIIANPGAFIGSIGVLFQAPNIEELAHKLGVKEQVVTAGAYKQMGTITRKWTPKEKAAMKTLVDDAYAMFVRDVSKARKLNIKKSTDYADAKVFLAQKAKNQGLIDEVGSLYQAQQELIALAKVSHPIWKKPQYDMEKFLKELKANSFFSLMHLENLAGQLR
ncbi:signal peptide peptidase SppA [Sulfurospirillum sp. 1612]|uniref:signal peptide peptidase SppA n=1 Tax=Sulfurospirillum sp. 1612 TaxID=3094835 RepID=UPI002F958055